MSARDVSARAGPLRAAPARREHGLGLRPDRRRARAAVARRAARHRDRHPGRADDRVPRAEDGARATSRTACCRSTRSSRGARRAARARACSSTRASSPTATRVSRSASTSASGGCSRPGCRCRSGSTSRGATSATRRCASVSAILRESIDAALEHREEALEYALGSAAAWTASAATASSACTSTS